MSAPASLAAFLMTVRNLSFAVDYECLVKKADLPDRNLLHAANDHFLNDRSLACQIRALCPSVPASRAPRLLWVEVSLQKGHAGLAAAMCIASCLPRAVRAHQRQQ